MKSQALISDLAGAMRPVHRLAPPAARVAVWLAVVLAAALALGTSVSPPGTLQRLLAAPHIWLAVIGSLLTTIAAATAAVLVSLPDRSPRWVWLPVPPLLLWQGASGMGCLHALPTGQSVPLLISIDECAPEILIAALPLALIFLLILRRATTLRPERSTLMAGLAVAAATGSLLWLYHIPDAGLSDLLIHALAFGLAILITRLIGARWLGARWLGARWLGARWLGD